MKSKQNVKSTHWMDLNRCTEKERDSTLTFTPTHRCTSDRPTKKPSTSHSARAYSLVVSTCFLYHPLFFLLLSLWFCWVQFCLLLKLHTVSVVSHRNPIDTVEGISRRWFWSRNCILLFYCFPIGWLQEIEKKIEQILRLLIFFFFFFPYYFLHTVLVGFP